MTSIHYIHMISYRYAGLKGSSMGFARTVALYVVGILGTWLALLGIGFLLVDYFGW